MNKQYSNYYWTHFSFWTKSLGTCNFIFQTFANCILDGKVTIDHLVCTVPSCLYVQFRHFLASFWASSSRILNLSFGKEFFGLLRAKSIFGFRDTFFLCTHSKWRLSPEVEDPLQDNSLPQVLHFAVVSSFFGEKLPHRWPFFRLSSLSGAWRKLLNS